MLIRKNSSTSFALIGILLQDRINIFINLLQLRCTLEVGFIIVYTNNRLLNENFFIDNNNLDAIIKKYTLKLVFQIETYEK